MAHKKQSYSGDTGEIRIRYVSKKIITDLSNIADNIGVSVANFLKPKLREIADSYPDKMKEPKKDY